MELRISSGLSAVPMCARAVMLSIESTLNPKPKREMPCRLQLVTLRYRLVAPNRKRQLLSLQTGVPASKLSAYRISVA